jgi:hypothetical protein
MRRLDDVFASNDVDAHHVVDQMVRQGLI